MQEKRQKNDETMKKRRCIPAPHVTAPSDTGISAFHADRLTGHLRSVSLHCRMHCQRRTRCCPDTLCADTACAGGYAMVVLRRNSQYLCSADTVCAAQVQSRGHMRGIPLDRFIGIKKAGFLRLSAGLSLLPRLAFRLQFTTPRKVNICCNCYRRTRRCIRRNSRSRCRVCRSCRSSCHPSLVSGSRKR